MWSSKSNFSYYVLCSIYYVCNLSTEHTEYVCKEILGMDDEEFTDLLVEEVIEIG